MKLKLKYIHSIRLLIAGSMKKVIKHYNCEIVSMHCILSVISYNTLQDYVKLKNALTSHILLLMLRYWSVILSRCICMSHFPFQTLTLYFVMQALSLTVERFVLHSITSPCIFRACATVVRQRCLVRIVNL